MLRDRHGKKCLISKAEDLFQLHGFLMILTQLKEIAKLKYNKNTQPNIFEALSNLKS